MRTKYGEEGSWWRRKGVVGADVQIQEWEKKETQRRLGDGHRACVNPREKIKNG